MTKLGLIPFIRALSVIISLLLKYQGFLSLFLYTFIPLTYQQMSKPQLTQNSFSTSNFDMNHVLEMIIIRKLALLLIQKVYQQLLRKLKIAIFQIGDVLHLRFLLSKQLIKTLSHSLECGAVRRTNASAFKKDESRKQDLILVSYLYRTRFFIFLLIQKSFRGAFRSFVWTIGPFHFLFERFFLGSFNFPSFYKLGNLLSLNFAKRKLLCVLCFHFSVAKFIIFRTFCVIGATLAPTEK